MKKLLIVADDMLVIQALKNACKSFLFFDEIVDSDQNGAIYAFRQERPTHIIINEYEESRRGIQEGADTWDSLLGLITREIVILSGHEESKMPNFIKLPFDPLKLRRFLIGN